MNRNSIKIAGAATLIALGMGGIGVTAALAEQNKGGSDTAEVQAFLAAPMSAIDAITAAEDDTGGKAMSVEFEMEETPGGIYAVEVAMTGGDTKTVAVNPADGSVTALTMDNEDDDGDGDHDTM